MHVDVTSESALANAQTTRFQEKREAVLSAAALQFNEQGVRGSTLADIATRVGLVTNSVTYYYRKKEDLATACFMRAIGAYERLAISAARETAVSARIAAFFHHQAQLLADIETGLEPPLVSFHDIRALPNPQAEEVFAAYTGMFRRVRGLLKGPETAHLGRDDLNARAHIILSVALWLRSWIVKYEEDEFHLVASRVSDLLVRGMAGAGVAWRAAAPARQGALQPSSATGDAAEAFLRAATFLVNEQGYQGASVDKIAARLNVTKGAFYHHNDTKHDLLMACFERTFSVMRRALNSASEAAGTGWERCCAIAEHLARYQLSEQGPLLRASATSALADSPSRARVRLTLQRQIERVGNVVIDGMMDGSIRPLDPAIAAQSLVAVINAAAELHRWVPGADERNVGALYMRPAFEGALCAAAASA